MSSPKSPNLSNKSSRAKIIVVVGPTASGKSALAVTLALRLGSGQARRKFGVRGAEIISADSRQVYRGMNIGSGKITRKEMHGVPNHLLDIASPKRTFTAAQYQKLAQRAMLRILAKGKVPIICGGTGFYIDAALYEYALPDIPPNPKLRRALEKKSAEELFIKLHALDSARAATIDRHNKRRLVRALEIIHATGKPVPSREEALKRTSPYDILKIGIAVPQKKLKANINKRLHVRIAQGMVAEVARLHRSGVSWRRLDGFGLEYRFVSRYLQGLLTKKEMLQELETAIRGYSRRQMTWFRKDRGIVWIGNAASAMKKMRTFLKAA